MYACRVIDRAFVPHAFAPCAGVSERVCFRAKVVRRFRGTGSGPALLHGHRRNLADKRERKRKRLGLCISAREIASNRATGFLTNDRARNSLLGYFSTVKGVLHSCEIYVIYLRKPRIGKYELEFYNQISK